MSDALEHLGDLNTACRRGLRTLTAEWQPVVTRKGDPGAPYGEVQQLRVRTTGLIEETKQGRRTMVRLTPLGLKAKEEIHGW